jgi:LmbE family N-acetylglucosaminyl deacetylase
MIHRQTRAGEAVVVVTVCAGDPPPGPLSAFAQSLHDRWQTPAGAAAIRRAEDLAALKILRAKGLHLDVPDCIYRTDPAGRALYASEASIFGELQPSEGALIRQTAERIDSLRERFRPAHLYAPFGLGRHIDHQLIRQAAELAGEVDAYYEDYPYAAKETVTPSATPLRPELVPLNLDDLSAKTAAIRAYVSQISTFWADAEAMAAAVWGFAAQVGGPSGRHAERLWRLS